MLKDGLNVYGGDGGGASWAGTVAEVAGMVAAVVGTEAQPVAHVACNLAEARA